MSLIVINRQSKDLFQARSSVKFSESLASVLHLIRQMPESPSVIPEPACNKSWFGVNLSLTYF